MMPRMGDAKFKTFVCIRLPLRLTTLTKLLSNTRQDALWCRGGFQRIENGVMCMG